VVKLNEVSEGREYADIRPVHYSDDIVAQLDSAIFYVFVISKWCPGFGWQKGHVGKFRP